MDKFVIKKRKHGDSGQGEDEKRNETGRMSEDLAIPTIGKFA